MRWNERLRLLQWRALEEADVEGSCLSAECCREATRAAAAGNSRDPLNTAQAVPTKPSSTPQFLVQRITWLDSHTGQSASKAMAYLQAHSTPSLLGIGWWSLGALVVGYQLSALGQDRVLNLLALPLMGVLIWNAIVIAWSLMAELRGYSTEAGAPGGAWLARVGRWVKTRSGNATPPPNEVEQRALARLHDLSGRMTTTQAKCHLRAGFHIAAAVLALGCVLGMYSRGWSREYRATWESTVFDAPGAQQFLGTLYAPASLVTGVAVPVNLIPVMHDSVAHVPEPQPALPWIHLYAGTLGLFVVLPRLLLATLALYRSQQRVAKLWQAQDWEGYAARLQRAIQGSGEHVQVLLHGWRDEARDRWARAIRQQLGGQVALEYESIAAGEEDEFAASWQPVTPSTVLVFNAAAIPEHEVQGTLAKALRRRLQAHTAGSRLFALVDTQPLRERRSGEGLSTRVALWQETLKGRVDEVIVTG